jgi:hypothetical protein
MWRLADARILAAWAHAALNAGYLTAVQQSTCPGGPGVASADGGNPGRLRRPAVAGRRPALRHALGCAWR